MLYIYFNGTKAQQSKYCYGVQQNNKTNVVRFIIEKQQGDIDLSWLSCTLKLQNAANDYLDLIDLTSNVIDNGVFLEITWLIESKSTQYKNLELQLQFMNEEEVWQTEICELELSNTIPVGNTVSSAESSLIQILISKVNECEQKVEELENRKYAYVDVENDFSAYQYFNDGFYAKKGSESVYLGNDAFYAGYIEARAIGLDGSISATGFDFRNISTEKYFTIANGDEDYIKTNYHIHIENYLKVDRLIETETLGNSADNDRAIGDIWLKASGKIHFGISGAYVKPLLSKGVRFYDKNDKTTFEINDHVVNFFNSSGNYKWGLDVSDAGMFRVLGNGTAKYYFNLNFFAPTTDTQDLGEQYYKWRDLHLSRYLTDGTNSITIADAANGTFNVINATDIVNNTLTQAQYDLITNGKPTLIRGENLYLFSNIFIIGTNDTTSYVYITCIAGRTNSNFYWVNGYINKSTKTILLFENSNIGNAYNGVISIYRKDIPAFPTANTSPKVLTIATNGGALSWQDHMTEWYGTQAEYDALGTYDSNTIYNIIEE